MSSLTQFDSQHGGLYADDKEDPGLVSAFRRVSEPGPQGRERESSVGF